MDWFKVEKNIDRSEDRLCMNKVLTIHYQRLPERQHRELPSGPVGRFLQYKQVPETIKYNLQSEI